MKKRQLIIKILISLLTAAVLTAAAGLGLLNTPDGAVSDALYQRGGLTDGEIVVIGIDQRAIESLGAIPWPRDIMADAIGYLNSDPENRPAVIGVDVLYVGESGDPGADSYLCEMAAEGGNVVVASAGTFGADLVVEGEDFRMDPRALIYWDEPFPDLMDVTETGHINTMPDNDGIIRHAMLYVDDPSGERVYSFGRVIYERWCEENGIEPNPLPENTDGFYYLPFTGRPGDYYEEISVVDLINGEVDPADFAGKIVLIGPYAAGLMDEYRTSRDHAVTMYGIEIQANIIDAFRSGTEKKEAGLTPQLIVVFLLTAVLMFFFLDRKVWSAAALWLIVSAGWLGIAALLYKRGVVLHALWVPLFTTVIFIAAVAANYIRAAREKRRVQGTFGRYVDPAIIRQLLEKGGEELTLGGKLYDIAVLFVDIRGFTTMSEALDPPTVVEIINMYLTLTTECIMRYKGTLDKFVGDCTMAFWNAPLSQEDPVFLACCAAMDMVEGSKALGEELMRRFGRTVSFGVGVNFGPAVVGNIGAPMRMDYTAIGDTVNTAARLEANAPAGTVYISRAVADALGDRAVATPLETPIKLKGKADGFEILTLDSLQY